MSGLAVRVRLRVRRGSLARSFVALVNSGYEADTPQLLIPPNLARELDLWPPPVGAVEAVFGTAGGPLKVWTIPDAAEVTVVTEDSSSKEIGADLVISHLADEPLISDKLAGALEIAVEDIAEGLWRFGREPKKRLRRSATP